MTKVVCINDTFPTIVHELYNALPRKGCVYTVRKVIHARSQFKNGAPDIGLLLVELENDIDPRTIPSGYPEEYSFKASRFAIPSQEQVSEEAGMELCPA